MQISPFYTLNITQIAQEVKKKVVKKMSALNQHPTNRLYKGHISARLWVLHPLQSGCGDLPHVVPLAIRILVPRDHTFEDEPIECLSRAWLLYLGETPLVILVIEHTGENVKLNGGNLNPVNIKKYVGLVIVKTHI
jgi:hypothetical protein|tara:strand:+ start:267 stop:674 length:408 start_codon:yes stop_codon:yes gene_type:complete